MVMSAQRSDLLPTLSDTLYLVGAGLVGVGLGIGVCATIFQDRAPVETATSQLTVVASRDGGAVEPSPVQTLPPAVVIVPGTPDPVQDDVAASAPPVEIAATGIAAAALDDAHQTLVPATPLEVVAPAITPDPVQDDVAAAAPPVDVAGFIGAVFDDPHPTLASVTPLEAAAPAPTPDPVEHDAEASAPPLDVAEMKSADAALPGPGEALPAAAPTVLVSLFRPAPAEENVTPVVRVVETPNECLVAEICIDDYLWAFYERTPKVDTNKVKERVKALVKRKGKTRTVVKTVTKYVLADFTWKDPIAAQRAGKSMKDYVIGGMDRRFKLKLYYALRAMDDAGLMPGITSAFRDDYRQGIASGNKAASDSSYHGGSRRGGYGHGMAADLVSVKGATRMQRFASTVELWKWIDAREQELGIGRPYLDRDPPHVGPIDGREFADKRGRARAKLLVSAANKSRSAAVAANAGVTKPAAEAAPVRVGSL
jgi:hypothetical protein